MTQSLKFPLNTWADVLEEYEEAEGVTAVRIEDAGDGSFLILTRERDRIFDTWVESAQDVEEYLATLRVKW